MKFLGIMFFSLIILSTLFANIKINGKGTNNLLTRFVVSIFGSFIITLVLGLPALGIYYLFTH